MDVLAVVRALKRHWRLTIPIVVLVAMAGMYVVFFSSSSYEATSTYVLFSPPAAPTPEEIRADPALELVHSDNPYARMDQPVVIDILTKRVNSDAVRNRLVAAGADRRYEVTTGGLYGMIASPTADIKSTASSPQGAIKTVKQVGAEFQQNLVRLQTAQGTDPKYMVRAEPVDPPTSATAVVSSRVRSLVAILGLGALLLFVAVSIGEAFDNMRRERTAQRSNFVLPYAVDRSDKREGHELAAPPSSGVSASRRVPVLGNGAKAPASTNGGSNLLRR